MYLASGFRDAPAGLVSLFLNGLDDAIDEDFSQRLRH